MTAEAQIGYQAGSLTSRFIVPPFSVLDTRQGYWQERKRAWVALGIRSELGRGDGVRPAVRMAEADLHYHRRDVGLLPPRGHARAFAQDIMRGEGQTDHLGFASSKTLGQKWHDGRVTRFAQDQASNVTDASALPDYADFGTAHVAPGTSIFDPVLCELVYRWWCPPAGIILDPFAGGSVRGIVAGYLGHGYTGVDLSGEQIEANRQQAAMIAPVVTPIWHAGDSRDLEAILPAGQLYDLVFTCPPYYDLEVYSDDPRDLSRAPSYDHFLAGYGLVLELAIARLLPGRFVVVVVSEIRGGPQGAYRGLVPDTIGICQSAGAAYYNEAVLINPAGSLPMRAGRQFERSRKLGRSHQNVLVFLKGELPDEGWSYERQRPPDPQLTIWDEIEGGAT
jgi:hypothetical protein